MRTDDVLSKLNKASTCGLDPVRGACHIDRPILYYFKYVGRDTYRLPTYLHKKILLYYI